MPSSALKNFCISNPPLVSASLRGGRRLVLSHGLQPVQGRLQSDGQRAAADDVIAKDRKALTVVIEQCAARGRTQVGNLCL